MDSSTLHRNALVIDSHNDTLVAHIRRGNLSLERGPEGSDTRSSGLIAFLRQHEDPREGS